MQLPAFPIVVYFVSILQYCTNIPIDNPSRWPGHLESFGSGQNTIDIEDVLYSWPSPTDFFKDYVDKCRPVLFKGVYKHVEAIHGWDDEYLGNNKMSENVKVNVEPNVKENRSAQTSKLSFRDFIESYHKDPILMFSAVPKHFKKDLLLPPPLKCNETTKHLVNANAVISRGESKTVVHNDDVETIYCAIQGKVDAILIEYTRNKNYVIDRPQGGYSSLDVDKVDYTMYPLLRKVDQYVRVELEEGDCFYAPYRWYKQINGHANQYDRNVGLNLWFRHLHDHVPTDCSIPDNEATLDKFHYSDEKGVDEVIEENKNSGRTHHEIFTGDDRKDDDDTEDDKDDIDGKFEFGGLLLHFQDYLTLSKSESLTQSAFSQILKKDEKLSQQNHTGLAFPETFDVLTSELFKELDVNNDTYFSNDDLEVLQDNETIAIRLDQYLEYQTARIEDYVEDLVEAKHHDEPLHVFEERMKEKFRSERKFDEL